MFSTIRTSMKRGFSSVSQFVCLVFSAVLGGCSLPSLEDRTTSTALHPEQASETSLGQIVTPQAQAHPGMSGIYPLADAHDAFAARAHLARAAQKTLDVQYYIWHGDITGTLLFDELRAAADRGVRLRLLLDDNGTAGLDTELAALHTHPNIEVRLFNPFVVRKPKSIGFLTDFMRVNRRMHNKSFTADNQATIIGGRNVGDEYFGAGETVLFADLDVLAVGAVVNDVSADFDRYWKSESSYPVHLLLPAVGEAARQQIRDKADTITESDVAQAYINAIQQSTFISRLLDGKLDVEWADTRMVSDDPAKGLGEVQADGMLVYQLNEILGRPKRNVDLISPYFVPTAGGVAVFSAMARSGIDLRILTNSLAATDVTAVHAGYAKRRNDLLAAGITLYELRRMSSHTKRNESAGPFGSSASSLHAKTFAVDGERVFIGSFNFDPRSAHLNTELGFVIESPAMAKQIATFFDQSIPESSYEVRLAESGEVYWEERRAGQQIIHTTEPETGLLARGAVKFLAILPIEWLL